MLHHLPFLKHLSFYGKNVSKYKFYHYYTRIPERYSDIHILWHLFKEYTLVYGRISIHTVKRLINNILSIRIMVFIKNALRQVHIHYQTNLLVLLIRVKDISQKNVHFL